MFTREEAQFIYENLSALQMPMSNPRRIEIVAVADSVLKKLEEILKNEDSVDQVGG